MAKKRTTKMAKATKAGRKHNFKHAQTTSASTTAPRTGVAPTSAPTSVSAAVAEKHDYSYVVADLRRIAILGGSLIVLEVVLWYLLNHTGLGTSIYSLVKVQ